MQDKAFGIYITTQEGLNEDLPWELHDLGAVAVETRDGTTMKGVEAERTVVFIAGFEAETVRNAAADDLNRRFPELEMMRVEITDDGWSEGWKQFFKPVVMDRLQVITPWMSAPHLERETIVIDPGQAFGTGGHATTKLMLQLIEKQSEQGFPEEILDVGTGSGVLAIACARLGAGHVLGFDVEEPAIEAAIENVERNGVAANIDLKVATPDQLDGVWPLVLANIQLAVFLVHAETIASLVAPKGRLFISGILDDQYEKCLSLWPQFELREVVREGEWLAMDLVKKA